MLFTSWTGRSCWVKGRIWTPRVTTVLAHSTSAAGHILDWSGLVRLQRKNKKSVNRKADFPYKASLMNVNVSSSSTIDRSDQHAQQLVLLFNDSLEVCKSAWAALNFHFNVIIHQLSANALLIFQVPRVGIICLPGRCWFTPLIFREICQIWDGRSCLSAVVIILVLSSFSPLQSGRRTGSRPSQRRSGWWRSGPWRRRQGQSSWRRSLRQQWQVRATTFSRYEPYSDDALSPIAGTLRGMDPRCAPSTVWRSRICPAELVGR